MTFKVKSFPLLNLHCYLAPIKIASLQTVILCDRSVEDLFFENDDQFLVEKHPFAAPFLLSLIFLKYLLSMIICYVR